MLRYLLITIFIIFRLTSFSQSEKRLEINCGYGYYESFALGVKYNLNESNKIGASLGTNFHFNDVKYYSASIENNLSIFRKRKNKLDQFKWYWTNKIIYWDMEDDYYRWNVLSISPAISRDFYINKKAYFSVDIGPLFTIVLESHRKTYREVGWPYHVMPNGRIQFIYCF